MLRRTSGVAIALLVIASSWYLAVYGCPVPLRAGPIFYEWKLGERGWGHWMPRVWYTENGTAVILDRKRNLIVAAPAEIMFSRKATSREAVFFPGTGYSVTIAGRNELVILASDGLLARKSIALGSAGRLRDTLDARRSTFGAEVDRVLIAEFPELREVIAPAGNDAVQ